MSRKRRMFDIEMPEGDEVAPLPVEAEPDGGATRRGPMASAVRENAESLRSRAEAEAAIRAENDALAHEYVRLRSDGMVLRRIPVDQVVTEKLARDRRSEDVEALDELKDSIRAIGLSNPIQVEAAGHGFDLIQGSRRLAAFRALHAETGDDAYASIPAVVRASGEALEQLYRRMVDENLVRKDISFAEMAALARDYARDPGTGAETLDAAVSALYGSANKQKRSYIRAFAELLDRIGDALRYPEALPRALGLDLRRGLADGGVDERALRSALERAEDAEAELAILRSFAGPGAEAARVPAGTFPAGNDRSADRLRKPKTTFQVAGPQGATRCTASAGRLELRLDEVDFSALDRRRLEEALSRFLSDIA